MLIWHRKNGTMGARFYMIAGYENDKYIELLGCYAHSADFELALYSDKVLSVVDRVWENSVKGKEIIQ